MHPTSQTPLAIVGMACRLPGADGLEAYWDLLLAGRSAIGVLPPDRLDQALHYDPRVGVRAKTYSRIGGLVAARAPDPQACPLPAELTSQLDPCHLTLWEVAAEACRHAGWNPTDLPDRKAGVFIGHSRASVLAGELVYGTLVEQTAEYLREVEEFHQICGPDTDAVIRQIVAEARQKAPRRNARGGPLLEPHWAAWMLAKGLGLDGPSMVINAACASGLTGLALGAWQLALGSIDLAVVGAASHVTYNTLVLFSHARSVSAHGSRPFDADADGLVTSEGYVVLLVKTLAKALADGNRIWAVIRGIGMSTDGRGKSLWAPRKEGQIEAVRRAYASGLDASRVQYIEAHATSTQLGDATEVAALAAALADRLPHGTRIPIGSVKSNIGHTLETAGLAGLVKTVLAMHHGMIPPTINLRKLNPQIDWANIPLYVPTSPIPWPAPADGHPRRGAINAFGIGGLNVHVVLDEAPFAWEQESARAHGPGCAAEVHASRTATGPDSAHPIIRPSPTQSDSSRLHRSGMPNAGVRDGAASRHAVFEPIAVIGMGAVLPGARTIEAFWDLVLSGRDATIPVPPDRWNPRLGCQPGPAQPWRSISGRGGFITGFQYDWRRHNIPPKHLATADPLQLMVLDAVDQALAQADHPNRPLDRIRTAVVVGVPFQGEFFAQIQMGLRLPEFQQVLAAVLSRRKVPPDQIERLADRYADVLFRHIPALLDETGSFSSSSLASRITKTFDLMGGAVILDAGSASGAAALLVASDMLRTGQCDTVICAGGDRSLGLPFFEKLSLAGLLANDPAPGPLDAHATGLVPGEGAAVVILQRWADAQRDNRRIYARIRGLGAARAESLDQAVARAVKRAISQAGVTPDQVAAVETSAVGLAAVDRQEMAGLAAWYATAGRSRPLLLGTLAAQIGHIAGAAGIVSLVKTAMALEHGRMPACAGLHQPAPFVAQYASHWNAPQTPIRLVPVEPTGSLLASVSCHDMNEGAYHVVLERAVPSPQVPPDPTTAEKGRATPMQEASRGAKPEPVASGVAGPGAALAYPPGGAPVGSPSGPAAAAIPAADGASRSSAKPGRPRVAFVFPGQGSQYPGMLKALIEQFRPAAEACHEIDAILARLHYPRFADLAWDRSEHLGKDVFRTQLAVLAADGIVHAAISALGIRPDRITGHSFGQFAALVAAGAWTFETAARATFARCQAIEACPDTQGGMLCVHAEREQVEQLCRQSGGQVFIANHNAPCQTIVAGDLASVARFQQLLAQEGLHAQRLAVPRPFHTPLMAPVQGPLRQALAELVLEPPTIPLLSSVTNRYTAEPEDLRAELVHQLTTPVRYVELIRRLADEGVTVFVEVGPEQILTRLHRQILTGRDVVLAGSDRRKGDGVAVLRELCATLVAAGVPVANAWLLDERADFAQKALDTPEGADRSSTRHMPTQPDLGRTRQAAQHHVPPPAPEEPTRHRVQPADSARASAPVSPSSALPCAPGNLSVAGQFAAPIASGLAPDRRPSQSPPSALTPAAPELDRLGVLYLSGSPFEMGVQQGQAQARAIRTILRRYADLADGASALLAPLDVVSARLEDLFDPDDLEEIAGIAQGAGVGEEAVLAHHLRLFPDLVGCSHFAVAACCNGDEGLIHAANEDLPIALVLRNCLTRTIQVRTPQGGIPHVLFGTAGEAGGINGLNGHGLLLTSAMLLDLPRRTDRPLGRLHGVLVKRILQRADGIDAALEILRATPRIASGWSLVISHGPTDEICYVEYDGEELTIQRHLPRVVAGNRSLLIPPRAAAPDHAQRRLQRLTALVGDGAGPISPLWAQEALRDRFDSLRGRQTPHPTMNTVRRVDNQISLVVQPTQQRLWVTAGPNDPGHEDHFYMLRLDRLLALAQPSSEPRPLPQLVSAPLRVPPRKPVIAREPAVAREPVAMPDPAAMADVVATPESVAAREAVSVPEPISEPERVSGPEPGAHLRRAELGPTPSGRPKSSPESQPIPGAFDVAKPKQAEAPGRMCGRFVLRLVESPLAETQWRPMQFHGRVVMVGNNPVVAALRRRLEDQGAQVTVLVPSGGQTEAFAALDRVWEHGPAPHLVLLGPYDADAATSTAEPVWSDRLVRGVLWPYWLCQRWFQRVAESGLTDRATVMACAALGGDFGFCGPVASAESGALAGLIKALAIEISRQRRSTFRSKIIDFAPGESAEQIAEIVCREWADPNRVVEVAYQQRRRFVVRPMLQPAESLRQFEVPRGGVWVVTGGARGVTAIVARELGRRFGLILHLIGSSPPPQVDPAWLDRSADELRQLRCQVTQDALARGLVPIQAWKQVEKAIEIARNLRALSEAGIRATYHSCDVRDRAALDRLLRQIRATDGPIQGIVHGAGYESALRFEKKKPADVQMTVQTKLCGAAALMELTREDPLQWFLAFGSISGRFGGTGQTDYCLANDMLAKLVGWYRRVRPDCRSVCFHWHSWDEVGMAVRPESKHIKDALLVRFMPTREGAEHVIEEILAGGPEPEILITDATHIQRYYPDLAPTLPRADGSSGVGRAQAGTQVTAVPDQGVTGDAGLAVGSSGGAGPASSHPVALASPTNQRVDSPSARDAAGSDQSARPSGWPMVDGVRELVRGERAVAEIHLDPTRDPFLAQHLIRSRPVFPLVASLETMAQTAAILTGQSRIVGVRDVEAVKVLTFFSDRPVIARVEARKQGETVACDVRSDFRNRQGQVVVRDQVHARAVVELAERSPWPDPPPPGLPPHWYEAIFLDREVLIYHGPVFRCLKKVYVDPEGGWGWIAAPRPSDLGGARRPDRWVLAPAVIDACFYACGVHYWRCVEKAAPLPSAIERLRLHRQPRPGEQCLLRFFFRGLERTGQPLLFARFDFALFGEDQTVLLEARNYRSMVFSESKS